MNTIVQDKENYLQLIQLISNEVLKYLRKSENGFNNIPSQLHTDGEVREHATALKQSESIYAENVLTAKALENLNSIVLCKKTIITPAAKDLIKERQIKVRYRESVNDSKKTGISKEGLWLFWTSCDRFEKLGTELTLTNVRHLKTIDSENIEKAIEEMNFPILNRQVNGGILIVENSAKANFLSRKFNHMLTVLGSSGKNIEEGIRQFDANLLIIEFSSIRELAMKEMIKAFTDRR